MPYPIYLATTLLFVLAKFGMAALLYSVAARLRGLSLIATGFAALGVNAVVGYAFFRILNAGGEGSRGLVGFFSALQVGIELAAWTVFLVGASMVVGELRSRRPTPVR